MPGHHCGNNRGAHLRQNPVLLPSLVEELADEDQDNARIEHIDAIELARPGGIRKACLDELLRQVLRPHYDGIGQDAQRKQVNEHPAGVRGESMDRTHDDEDHHPYRHGTRSPSMPRAC